MRVLVTVALALAVCPEWSASQEHGRFELVLELNYLSAERTIELYQGLSGSPNDIAGLRGSQLALATTGLLSGRRIATSDLEEALGSVKFNQSLGDDLFRMRDARDNIGPLKELYAELRRRNFGQRVASTVEQLFPPGVRVTGTLPMYFVAFGPQSVDAFVRRVVWRGDTPVFVAENEGEPTIVVNLAKAVHYGRSVDERFIGLLSTVAHEVFHAAFDAYKDQSPVWQEYYAHPRTHAEALLDLSQNEGIAYYLSLIQTARGRLPRDWEDRVATAFEKFNFAIDELLAPRITSQRAETILRTSNTSGYWESFGSITGMIMAKSIDQGMGRNALSETIAKGALDFFYKYIDLTRRDPSLPRLSPSLVLAVQRATTQ